MASFAPLVSEAAPFDDAVAAVDQGNYAKARELFAQASEAGDPRAQFNLGRMLLEGEGGPRDYALARQWSEKSAAQGIPGAQYDMGWVYQRGLGVRRDSQVAIKWYERAARQGFSTALVALGDIYLARGRSPTDLKRAAEFYGEAAEQGDADAAVALARLTLKYDLGLSRLTPRARFNALMDSVFGPGGWRETGGFRTSIRENQLRAQGALTVAAGARSAHSIGTPEAPGAYDLVVVGLSPEQAAQKLRASKAPLKVIFPEAAHGSQGPHLHVEPFTISFDSVSPGQVGSEDPAKVENAAKWLRSVAAQGHPGAQLWMGRLYARPRARPAELATARLWFTRALDNPQADPATRRQAKEAMLKLKLAPEARQFTLGMASAVPPP